jgi:hypothetical protein
MENGLIESLLNKKDILTYGQNGGKIMAKNGRLEQSPSMGKIKN